MSALAPSAAMPPAGVPHQIQIGGPGPQAAPGPGASGAPGAQGAGGMSDQEWEQIVAQVALPALRKLGASAPDHQEAAVIDQCVLALQKLLASRQSGAESALGVTPAHKAMSRAY